MVHRVLAVRAGLRAETGGHMRKKHFCSRQNNNSTYECTFFCKSTLAVCLLELFVRSRVPATSAALSQANIEKKGVRE